MPFFAQADVEEALMTRLLGVSPNPILFTQRNMLRYGPSQHTNSSFIHSPPLPGINEGVEDLELELDR